MNAKAIAVIFASVIQLGSSAHGADGRNEGAKNQGVVLPEDQKHRELSTKFTRPITFRFVDEHDRPIQGDFTLHQYKDGKYFDNWHRYLPLDEKGEITIREFPPEFEFGGASKDQFYEYWLRSSDLDPSKTNFLYRCSPSGAMKFQITTFPKKYYGSLEVEYHKKNRDGNYEFVRGIGIFPDDPQTVVGGLDPGEYFIAVKFHYEDPKPIYKSETFEVALKKYTTLPKIGITEAAIENSKR
jgi:hypothetical protein